LFGWFRAKIIWLTISRMHIRQAYMKAMAKFARSYLVSSVSSVIVLPKLNWTVKERNTTPAVTYSHTGDALTPINVSKRCFCCIYVMFIDMVKMQVRKTTFHKIAHVSFKHKE
jgi:hypothetical protein